MVILRIIWKIREPCFTPYMVLDRSDKPFRINEINYIFKAFDKVPQLRLMQNLSQCGTDGVTHGWIKCWLRNRKQGVLLNGNNL